MPKTKANVDAVQAMQEALHGQDKAVLQLDSLIRQHMATFLAAFREVRPDTPFSVLDVMGWAGKYQAIRRSNGRGDANFTMPAIFNNAYALGRLLKKSQEELGIQHVGSYGNRAIYNERSGIDG